MLPKVQLFGEPKVLVNNREHRFQPSRRFQLLAYLAYAQARVSREKLADVFWSQTPSQAARRNLRKVLFEAKNLEWAVGFNHDEGGASWPAETDVAEFEEAIRQRQWARAIELYKGSFLAGLQSDDGAEFDAWLEGERLRLETLYQEAAENFVETLGRQGKTDEALDFLKQLLLRDALDESLHQQVMRLEFKRGNTEAALEQFERCREVLQKELGVEPLPETLELLKTIEQGGGTQAKRALLLKTAKDVPNLVVHLVGREKLLQEALQLLRKGEKVLLHGFGGMGKTALAATVAKRFVGDKQNVLWLQVGSDNPEVIFDALVQPFDAGQDIVQAEDKTKALRAVLQKQRLSLLVLDDVWNAYALSKVMEALPKDLPLLVTSRQRYPKLTKVYVDRLEREASLELLRLYGNLPKSPLEDSVGKDVVVNTGDSNQSGGVLRSDGLIADTTSNQLCELLGDHPFALRLAGLALQEDKLTAEQLYEQIKHNPHDFKMPGELREVGRESVAALLNVSLETLDDRAYETFLSYGLLDSPMASAGFLAACLDREINGIEDALFSLVQRGLAERVSKPGSDLVSYRIHDLAHSYAKANRFQRASTLVRSGLAFLKAHKDEVELLDMDIANILAAAQLTKERGQENELVDLMYLLTVEGAYYTARGHNRRSLGFLEVGAKLAEEQGRLEEAHYLFAKVGEYYFNFVKHYPLAFKFYSDSLRMAQLSGNQSREAILLGLIAITRFHQAEEDVDDYLNQAYELAKQTGDDECLCRVLDYSAQINATRGDVEQARRLHYDSLNAIDRLSNSQHFIASEITRNHFFILLNLGETERRLGNFSTSIEMRERALKIAEKAQSQIWMGYAHYELGETLHSLGNRRKAEEHMCQALKLFEQNSSSRDLEAVQTFLKSEGYLED